MELDLPPGRDAGDFELPTDRGRSSPRVTGVARRKRAPNLQSALRAVSALDAAPPRRDTRPPAAATGTHRQEATT
jgi:hypothetical protein